MSVSVISYYKNPIKQLISCFFVTSKVSVVFSYPKMIIKVCINDEIKKVTMFI